MCGIVGIVVREGSVDPYLERLDEAVARLFPRGPDHGDRVVLGRAAFGHRRLAIIDTSPAGNQPMTDETGRYTIVYNGELYNYRELRRQLTDQGMTFLSQSDTEVMLKLFIARGPAAVDDAIGFFAFAVYDAAEERLFLARDRFGIKPLYYYQDEGVFMFASELKSILAFPIDKRIDDASLFQYLQLSYVPAPHTMLEAVKKLEPGCRLETDGRETTLSRYYEVPAVSGGDKPGIESYDHAVERVRTVLEDAVRMRLVSELSIQSIVKIFQ